MAGEAADAERRERLIPRTLVPLMLALALVQLCIAGLIGWTIYAERQTRAVARRETNALLAVNQLVQATLDAETGQRGYLLTGRELYLEPYTTARQRAVTCERVLSDLLASNDETTLQPHLAALEKGVDAKLAELDQTVSLIRKGNRDEALAKLNSDSGKRQMDAIRAEARVLTDSASARRATLIAQTTSIENWSLVFVVLFALGSLALLAIGLRSEGDRARIAAEIEHAAALQDANDRAQLLARELNHRVKNFFSIVMAIVSLSGRKRPEARAVVDDIHSRIHALALAHEVSQGELIGDGVSIGALVRRIAAPYATEDDDRIRLNGAELALSTRMVTPLGLIVHELATNAVKYGALSSDGGRVEVAWEVLPISDSSAELYFQWIELCATTLAPVPDSVGAPGFGSRMIELAVKQIGGRIERDWPDSGAVVRLMCPLR